MDLSFHTHLVLQAGELVVAVDTLLGSVPNEHVKMGSISYTQAESSLT